MDLASVSFDPQTLALMGRVCDEVWREIQNKDVFPSLSDEFEIRRLVARKVMTAVAEGERDPERLRAVAMHSIDG
jgi:hypothetical protein